MRRVPHFVKMVAAVVVLGLLLVVAFSVRLSRQQHDINRAACERAVATREDNRAMWLYLVDKNPDPTSDDVTEFVAYLDQRLPSLECVGELPVPAPVDSVPG